MLFWIFLLGNAHDANKGLDDLSLEIKEPLNILRRQVRGLRKEGYDIPLFRDE